MSSRFRAFYIICCTLAVTLIIGCGGNQSNSPFSGTTLDGRDPSYRNASAGPGSKSGIKPGSTVPVFITGPKKELEHETWITLKELSVEDGNSKRLAISSGKGVTIELSRLGGKERPRYLYVGSVRREGGYQAVHAIVSAQYSFLSGRGVKKARFPGGDKDGNIDLSCPLDPMSNFRDALVVSLDVPGIAEGKPAPVVGLGSALDVLDLDLQEPCRLSGSVTRIGGKAPKQSITLSSSSGIVALFTSERTLITGDQLKEGAQISAIGIFNPASNGFATISIEASSKVAPVHVIGTGSYDSKSKQLSVRPSIIWGETDPELVIGLHPSGAGALLDSQGERLTDLAKFDGRRLICAGSLAPQGMTASAIIEQGSLNWEAFQSENTPKKKP